MLLGTMRLLHSIAALAAILNLVQARNVFTHYFARLLSKIKEHR